VRTRVPAVALAVLLAAAGVHAAEPAPGAPPPIELRARVEPETVTIGSRFRYTLEVWSRPGVEVLVAQPTERIGDFEIVDFGIEPAAEREGRTVIRRWYTLVGWAPGEHLIESPPVQYRLPGEDLADAPKQEVRISIESLLAKQENAADIRDIKGPEPVPIDWRPYWLLGGGLAALLAFGALLYRVANRPRRTAWAPPPTPAHEVAAQELERLRARGLVQQGAFKEYYSALSDIVRRYVERRFELRAPEMTTEEFLLVSARGGRLAGPHRALLGDFLTESDLVKFARHVPTIAQSDRAWTAARRFVDETAAEPRPEGARAAG
jgi:hypothetical protein